MPPPDPIPPDIARLLDACANRAREAARTLEDVARFVLADADLTASLKQIRHDLTAALAPLDRGRLLAARLAADDVGTRLATPAEADRAGLPAIVDAAGSRLGEALRSIEEALKVASPAAAAAVEQLRYQAYDAARDVRMTLGTGRARQWRLCALITESACQRPWVEVARLAIKGGADCLQLREKDLPDRELLRRARRLVDIARTAGPPAPPPSPPSVSPSVPSVVSSPPPAAQVIINDRPDIALLAGADGVHLGQDDLTVADARRIAGFDLLIGVSCSTLAHAREAARAGADTLGLGPMFASGTKPKAQLAGPALIEAVRADPACARLPHLAISGIDSHNIAELTRAGCRGVAVCAAICSADDPARAAAEILERLMDDPH